ncbi:cell division protein ZapA [Aneurinibacillus uraniidurans]|uniref:cell division protein ZapA n=1 Tax=Aneurinibacillus uraniidurans TaxID=2966586 RepID=UPI00234AD77A|nr:cell division protein ZapA [Aneurinibacillus sp. B1]WCN38467.1 cell division protein ZapA [Aneurinibacillus sp. B1]
MFFLYLYSKETARGGQTVSKEKVVVEIFGQYYTMVGDTSSSHMRMVAGYVDDKMRQISAVNPRLDTNKLAVLAALNMADEYFKLRLEYEELIKLLEKTAAPEETEEDVAGEEPEEEAVEADKE